MLCQVAKLYLKMGMLDQCKEEAEKAVQIFKDLDDAEGKILALHLIGEAEHQKVEDQQNRNDKLEAKELIYKVKVALEERDGEAFKAALDKCYSNENVTVSDMEESLGSLIDSDPEEIKAFWISNHPDGHAKPREPKRGYVDEKDSFFDYGRCYDRRFLYYIFRAGNMGYGPGLRLIKTAYRKGKPGYLTHSIGTMAGKDYVDEWEEYVGHHVMLYDGALQMGATRVMLH